MFDKSIFVCYCHYIQKLNLPIMLQCRTQPTLGLYKKPIYDRILSYTNYLHSLGIPHCSELTYSLEVLSVTVTGHNQL